MGKLVLVVDEDPNWLIETSDRLEEHKIEAVFVRKASAALTLLGLGDNITIKNCCLACGKALVDEHSIKFHQCKLKSALSSKYPCPQTGCSETFTIVGQLVNHQKHIHGLTKDCICAVCNKEFPSLQALGGHKASHIKQHEKEQINEHMVLLAIENLKLKREVKGGKPGLVLTKFHNNSEDSNAFLKVLKENKVPTVELVPKNKSNMTWGSTEDSQEPLYSPLGEKEILRIKNYIK